MKDPRLYATSTPISDEFKSIVQPVATAVCSSSMPRGSSMQRGTGLLLEHALGFYKDLHPELGSPQADFFVSYIKYVDESGLYRAVKGTGKQNRSFVISGETEIMKNIGRMRSKYMLKHDNRCIRLLLPMGIVIQDIEDLKTFTFPEIYNGWFATIKRMIDDGRKSRDAASRPQSR